MASPGVEYLGVMAWAAQFQWIPDKIGPGELAEVRLGGNKCRVGEKVEFVIDVPDKSEVGLDKLEAEVAKNQAALDKATSIREKEQADFSSGAIHFGTRPQ